MEQKNNEHLPVIGVGPLIVNPQLLLTIIGIVLSKILWAQYELNEIRIILIVAGVAIILFAVYMWYLFILKTDIDAHIKNNELVTTGVYSWIRNPSYSAFWLICIGAIVINANPILLFIPVVCWFYMTVFLKKTEEK